MFIKLHLQDLSDVRLGEGEPKKGCPIYINIRRVSHIIPAVANHGKPAGSYVSYGSGETDFNHVHESPDEILHLLKT